MHGYAGKIGNIPAWQKKLKKIQKSCFKRLTDIDKCDIIVRLCKNALYGLRREVTENPRLKAALADNFR